MSDNAREARAILRDALSSWAREFMLTPDVLEISRKHEFFYLSGIEEKRRKYHVPEYLKPYLVELRRQMTEGNETSVNMTLPPEDYDDKETATRKARAAQKRGRKQRTKTKELHRWTQPIPKRSIPDTVICGNSVKLTEKC